MNQQAGTPEWGVPAVLQWAGSPAKQVTIPQTSKHDLHEHGVPGCCAGLDRSRRSQWTSASRPPKTKAAKNGERASSRKVTAPLQILASRWQAEPTQSLWRLSSGRDSLTEFEWVYTSSACTHGEGCHREKSADLSPHSPTATGRPNGDACVPGPRQGSTRRDSRKAAFSSHRVIGMRS